MLILVSLENEFAQEIKHPSWIETLGLEDCLSKDWHLGHLLGFDENGGMLLEDESLPHLKGETKNELT